MVGQGLGWYRMLRGGQVWLGVVWRGLARHGVVRQRDKVLCGVVRLGAEGVG